MKESDLQRKIIKALTEHPNVAWVINVTSGTVKIGKHYIKLGKYHFQGETHDGTSDLIGQLADGTLFAIEVKLPGKEPTSVQNDFLYVVNMNGGASGWADSVEGAINIIEV